MGMIQSKLEDFENHVNILILENSKGKVLSKEWAHRDQSNP